MIDDNLIYLDDNEEEVEFLDLVDRYNDIILDYDIDYPDQFTEVIVQRCEGYYKTATKTT